MGFVEYAIIVCLVLISGSHAYMAWDNVNHNLVVLEGMYELERAVDGLLISAERLEMYNISLGRSVVVNGVYFPSDKYYCVWTGGRNESDWLRTECHEQCHALIDDRVGFDHFCCDSQRYTCKK